MRYSPVTVSSDERFMTVEVDFKVLELRIVNLYTLLKVTLALQQC